MISIKKFPKKTLGVVISQIILGMTSYSAIAQEPNTDEKDKIEIIDVVATGYADSLSKALSAKRYSSGVVDSILAEDIADFPDQNLADSLQRIPGITITREGGEGRDISVRGLNSTFTQIQLNGMQTQSLSAGTGGITSSRSFDFNVFASELFNSLEVYKTTSANLEEGSLGATVALTTGRPFNYTEDVAAFNFSQSYNEQSEKSTPRASGIVSFTNDEDTLGALFSLAYSDRNINNAGVNSGRWATGAFGDCTATGTAYCQGATAAERGATLAPLSHPRFPRMADKTQDQQRIGATATFQWIPADSTLVTVDALFANITSKRLEPFMQAISLARSGANGIGQSSYTDLQVDTNGTIFAGTVDEVDVRSEYFKADWESDFTQFSINVQHDLTDELTVNVLVGTSKSELSSVENTVAFEHFSSNDPRSNITYDESTSSVTYDFSDRLNPLIAYGFDTTNPANWELSEFRDRVYSADSENSTAKIEFEYILNDEITLSGGVTAKEYSFDYRGARADDTFDSKEGADGTACGIEPEVTSENGGVVSFGGQSFFMADSSEIDRLHASNCWELAERQGETRSVEEDAFGFYVQADFEYELGEMMLRGNAGVRSVSTDVSASGFVDGDWVTVETDYSDTLPSINLALDLTDDVILRTSWAKVMSRPELSRMNPGGSVDNFSQEIRNGNPFLKPFRSDSFDLSAEWYFAEGAIISLAYFQKDIESFTENKTETVIWSDTGLPDSLLGPQADDLRNAQFEVSRPVNGEGGDLDGFEIQYQQQLTFLPGPEWMQKFGVLANMTFVDSNLLRGTDADGNKVYGPLEGQSDKSSNFTLYWEDDVFSGRVSLANRSGYLNRFSGNRTVEDSSFVDASLSYQVNENLTVKFDALNLTDEVIVRNVGDINRIMDSVQTGRQYSIGISYKM